MGIVMGVTSLILGMAAGLTSLLVWTSLMFPAPTTRARAALEARPGRCFLTGMGLTLLLGVPMFGLLHAPSGLAKLGGWALALPLLAILVAGIVAMAQLLGDRLRSLSPAMTPLGALVRGAVIIELAAIIPFVGWFLFTPLVGLTLAGAGALGWIGSWRQTIEPQRRGEQEEESKREFERTDRVPLSSVPLAVLCASVVPFLR